MTDTPAMSDMGFVPCPKHEGAGREHVEYSVVPIDDKEWVVRRDGTDLARRSCHAAALSLAAHLAWRECSRGRVRTVVYELDHDVRRRTHTFDAPPGNLFGEFGKGHLRSMSA
jgi:hypothetical protein